MLETFCQAQARIDQQLTGYRYVLKNKDTGDVLFVVVFTLVKKEDVDKDEVKKAEEAQEAAASKGDVAQEENKSKEAGLEGGGGGDDDVD